MSVNGVLIGYDTLNNMVLDKAEEILEMGATRQLGLMVVRGTAVQMIAENEE